jgi:hypothetical protein
LVAAPRRLKQVRSELLSPAGDCVGGRDFDSRRWAALGRWCVESYLNFEAFLFRDAGSPLLNLCLAALIWYFVLDPFEKPPMITAIVVDGNGQPQIKRYETDNHRTARDSFVREWIDGGMVWEYEEFAGPNCTAKVPAFSPDFLRRTGFTDEAPKVVLNVFIYEWRCATGPRYSDQHCVTGYFVLDL